MFSVIADIILLKFKNFPLLKVHKPQHEGILTAFSLPTVKEAEGSFLTSLYTESVESEH
jgi:hypothetical protein